MQIELVRQKPPAGAATVGKKLAVGYLPFTLVAVLAVVLFVNVLVSQGGGPHAVAGGLVALIVWPAQIAMTNLLIACLPFDRLFPYKALAISIASLLLLPVLIFLQNPLRDAWIGRPDLATYIGDGCHIVGKERVHKYRYRDVDYWPHYEIEAALQCPGEKQARTCEWAFWYDRINEKWEALTPSCAPNKPAVTAAS